MIKNYRAKPKKIRAVRWTGDNLNEIKDFLGEAYLTATPDQVFFHHNSQFESPTGLNLFATRGDYIINEIGTTRYERKKKAAFDDMFEED